MVSTKNVGRTPVTSSLMSPNREAPRDGRHLAELGRHQISSPALLIRREKTRLEPAAGRTAEVKDIKSLFTANGVNDAERQNKREYVNKTAKPNLFRMASNLDVLSNQRLVRNVTSLDRLTSKQKDVSLEIYKKIRRESGLADLPAGNGRLGESRDAIWTENEVVAMKTRQIRSMASDSSPTHAQDAQTNGNQRMIGKTDSLAQISAHADNSPQHLPSLARDDVKHDVMHKREDRFSFDNPRFSIPAARGLTRYPTVAPAGGQHEGEQQPSRIDHQQQQQQQQQQQRQQRHRAESLPVTIMDIANATSGIRQSRTGQCLFNNDADVRRFRDLIRDTEVRLPNAADVSKMKHINYCNREKTNLILKWLAAVDPRRVPEGAWSGDTGTNDVNKDDDAT